MPALFIAKIQTANTSYNDMSQLGRSNEKTHLYEMIRISTLEIKYMNMMYGTAYFPYNIRIIPNFYTQIMDLMHNYVKIIRNFVQ